MREDETLITTHCVVIGVNAVESRIGLPVSNLQRRAHEAMLPTTGGSPRRLDFIGMSCSQSVQTHGAWRLIVYPLSPDIPSPIGDAPSRGAHHRWVALMIIMLCVGVSRISSAAPIATNTALPLSAHELIVRGQFVLTRASDHVAGTRRNVDRFEARTVLGYGLTAKLALFGVAPLVDINRKFGDVSASEFGLGDAALFARYEVFRADQPAQTFRLAPYTGLRLPTGRDEKTGDGSVDVFGGVIATLASTQWVLDTQLRYNLNREAEGFERGDSISVETSWQYRLSPGRVTQDTRAFVFGVIELSFNHYERDRVDGSTNPNSGGFQLYLTPGLQYATRRWIADVGVRIPIVNDLHGMSLAPDYAILTSIRINF